MTLCFMVSVRQVKLAYMENGHCDHHTPRNCIYVGVNFFSCVNSCLLYSGILKMFMLVQHPEHESSERSEYQTFVITVFVVQAVMNSNLWDK